MDHGAQIGKIVSRLNADDIVENFGTLLSRGAEIDADELVSRLSNHRIIENLDILLSHGAQIDVDELMSKNFDPDLLSEDVIFYLLKQPSTKLMLKLLNDWRLTEKTLRVLHDFSLE